MSFLTAHSAGETVGPEDTPGGKGALVSPPDFDSTGSKGFSLKMPFISLCPPPRFFGPTDASDSNNIDFYKFWQDVKLLVFSSKSPKQSHSILF